MSPSSRAITIERRVKLFFFLATLILLFWVITQVENMFVSFLLAFVTYYLMAPAVDYMERHGLSRVWATTLPFLALTVVAGVCFYIFVPDVAGQIKALQENSPKYLEASRALLAKTEGQFGDLLRPIFPTNLQDTLESHVSAWATAFLKQLPDFLSKSFTVLLLTPFLAFFMLLNGRDFVRSLVSLVPNNFFELALNLNYQISSQMGGFVRARLLESIIVGALLWTGFALIGFPYGLVLALFASLLNIIPYLGPVLGAVPAFVISLANGGSPSEMLELLAIFGFVQVIDTVILVPFLVAKIVDLHPVTVVLAILIGSQTMGILGMIICIPVVSALKVTSSALYHHFTDFRT